MATINDLYSFIDRAQRDRKYLPNTATSLRSPLRLIDPELTEDEKNSLEKLVSNLDQIFHIIFSKNSKISAASIETYKSRINRLISDYEKYGKDPSKMAGWNPEVTPRKGSGGREKLEKRNVNKETHSPMEDFLEPEQNKVELSLGPGKKAIIITPREMDKKEYAQLQAYIEFLKTTLIEKKIDEVDNGGVA